MKRQAIGVCGVVLGTVLGVVSCNRSASGPPPAPDFTAAQRVAWQLAPADAMGGLVLADLGHTLERLRAMRTVLATGPVTKTYIDKGMAMATLALGFDPLDAEGWKKNGVDPSGPVAFFLGPEKAGLVVFRATNPDTAKEAALRLYKQGGTQEPFDCAKVGELFRCGTPTWQTPTDPQKSLWPHLEANLPATHRGMELLVYAPLDQGEAKQALALEKIPIKGAHAGYLGLTFAPERVVMRMGARVEDTAKLVPYLTPRSVPSLLGIAGGGISAGRMTFSPDAILAFAKTQIPAEQVTQGLAMFQALAGFDLEKDVFQNMTGEIITAGYRSEKKTGEGGKAIPYSERLGSAMVVGTRDDAASRRIADRVGELVGGAIGQFGDTAKTMGVTPSYRSDAGERKVHWFSVAFDAEKQKVFGAPKLDIWLTTIPGGLACGMGPVGLEEVKKRAGQKPAALLDKLPLREERALFEKSPMVFWALVGEGFATQMKLQTTKSAIEAVNPDAAKAMMELVGLGQLVYDAVAGFEVSSDRADLFYQVTFL